MFKTIDEIKAANKQAGENWFSADSLSFWNSRIWTKVYGGRYFVTSDGPDENGVVDRRYSVRVASDDGTVKTAEGTEFREFSTAQAAAEKAQELADRDAVARLAAKQQP